MNSKLEEKHETDLGAVARLLSWFTVCYLFSFINFEGTSQGLYFWFVSLLRPSWCIPNWAVTPGWTIVYGLIAWAAWDIWKLPPDNERSGALISFFSLLVLNAVWPWLYFSLHLVVLAILAIALHFLLAILTAVLFSRLISRSGYLAIPFLAWAGYSTILYIVVWKLNK